MGRKSFGLEREQPQGMGLESRAHLYIGIAHLLKARQQRLKEERKASTAMASQAFTRSLLLFLLVLIHLYTNSIMQFFTFFLLLPLLLLTTHRTTKPPEANTFTARSSTLIYLKHPSLHPPRNFPFLFFVTSSLPNCERPAFRLALDGWPKRTIVGNLSFFIHRSCHSPLNLSLIIVLKSGIELHFSYSLLFEIRSVSRVSRTICWQFLWKTSKKFSSAIRSAHAFRVIFDHCQHCSLQYFNLGLQTYLPILNFFFLTVKNSFFLTP